MQASLIRYSREVIARDAEFPVRDAALTQRQSKAAGIHQRDYLRDRKSSKPPPIAGKAGAL